MLLRKKTKQNPIVGCFVLLLALIGFMLVCFLFCTVIFQLDKSNISNISSVLNLFLG